MDPIICLLLRIGFVLVLSCLIVCVIIVTASLAYGAIVGTKEEIEYKKSMRNWRIPGNPGS